MEISARKRLLNTVFDIKENKNRSSLSPCGSSKSLKLRIDTLNSETSINSSISSTPRTALRQEVDNSKPISLVIIEKYFSDICQSIASKGSIDQGLLSKAGTMQDVLKDCLTVIHDLSLQFYVLMASALKEIQQIDQTQDQSLYSTLAKKLLQLADLIEENKYTSQTDRVTTLPSEEFVEFKGLQSISKELIVRMNRVTARVLNIWKKILSPQREFAVISCAFLLLYCEVDNSLKISPNSRIPVDTAIAAMRNYLANPGHVVTVVRKTKEFVDKEMISVETFQRIHDLLGKITLDQVKVADKTLTGLAVYELILFAVKYFEVYAQEHYKLNIFLQENGFDNKKPGQLNEALSDRRPAPIARQSNPKSPISPQINIKKEVAPRKSAEFIKKKPLTKYQPPPSSKPRTLEPSHTQKNLKPHSASPTKKSSLNPSSGKSSPLPSGIRIEDPSIRVIQKPLDKSLLVAKQIIATPKSNSNRTTPVRNRKNNEPDNVRAKDVLEEMQYQQFIEEKFRHFLVDKLKKESENFVGMEKNETKIAVEVNAVKKKEAWIEEFEKWAGVVRFNACKKLSEDKRYTAELIRAQRQLDILERFQ